METLNELKSQILSEQSQTVKNNSIFDVKSANACIEIAKKQQVPRMLFGELWYEGEICILFADTNVGKSILAVQIANSISTGVSTCGLQLECPPTPIIYFDFEMSPKQFERRYSKEFEHHYVFSDNFFKADFDLDYIETKANLNIEDYLFQYLEKLIAEHQHKILIIDNITYLKDDNEKAKDAGPLMKLLKILARKYKLSLLVLAHTPKIDPHKPITKNHLSGSKVLMSLCDSSFTIGMNHHHEGRRYIKQIKQRSCEEMYGSEKVIVCEIEKPHNFLQLSFVEFDQESNQLKVLTDGGNSDRDAKIVEMFKQGTNKSEIGRILDISESLVRYVLKKNNL
jgi:RecA-family ATPase